MTTDPLQNTLEPGARIDLSNCDREPIHFLGRVQSYGALIAVSSDWIIQHASANLEAFLGTPAEDAIGQPLKGLLGESTLAQVRRRLRANENSTAPTRIFGFAIGARAFDLSIHQSGRHLIFEFEDHADTYTGSALSETYPLIQSVRQACSFAEMCREAARGMQALSGFDSVMVYQFGEDHSGTVVAESKMGDAPSYLDLRFPASDIPVQARELYKRSLLRLIADVNDPGSPILPERSPEGRPVDLSLTATRAVSPIHIEYLQNMGVAASLSASIIEDGELWGLFACHHRAPRYVSYEKRTAIELFAHLFSYELMRLQADQRTRTETRSRELQSKLMMQMADGSDLAKSLRLLAKDLNAVIPHDGVVLYAGGRLAHWGETPGKEQFMSLARYLNTTEASRIFATDMLSQDFPAAEEYASQCAGILAVPISRSPRDYLVLCRKEVAQTVSWAGNPEKPAQLGPHGTRLTPRKSFEAWKQTVSGQSVPWSPDNLAAAEFMRTLLLEIFLRISDQAAEERERAKQRHDVLIAELNHRVRNILNLMRGLITQSRSEDLTVDKFAASLDGRIHALARANDQLTRTEWAPVALSELFDFEFAAYVSEATERVHVEGGDVLVASEAYTTLALVIHELVTNSVKYGALSVPTGRVEITLSRNNTRDLVIDWREVGGPEVKPPSRHGFGTAIIDRSIPFELRGEASVSYKRSGLEARFTIPEGYLSEAGSVVSLQNSRRKSETRLPELSGTALVVEDSMIVAMDASDILSEFGAGDVRVAGSVEEALARIEDQNFEVALLDVNLGREKSLPVAEALAARGVRFVLVTGYSDTEEMTTSYPSCAVVQKPFSKEAIGEALVELGFTGG